MQGGFSSEGLRVSLCSSSGGGSYSCVGRTGPGSFCCGDGGAQEAARCGFVNDVDGAVQQQVGEISGFHIRKFVTRTLGLTFPTQ